MKGKKNDFSLVFFKRPSDNSGGQHNIVYRLNYVHNTDKACKWLDQKSIEWDYVNVYNRRTRQFLQRIYRTQ